MATSKTMKRAPKRVWLVQVCWGDSAARALSEKMARDLVDHCDSHKDRCRLLGEYVRVEKREKKG